MRIFIILALLLAACVKDASEMAAETSLSQVNAIEKKIQKDCPQGDFAAEIMVLKSSIKGQLTTCEVEKSNLRERNNTLLAVIGGLLLIILALCWNKIRRVL